MFFSIKKRHVLVFSIAVAQAISLGTGVFVFNVWLSSSLRETIEQQVLADNVLLAGQLSKLIPKMNVSDLRDNRESWGRLQESVLAIQLPNEGFVCVVDARNGGLLCHPALGEPTEEHSSSTMVKPGMVKPGMVKPGMVKPGMVKPSMVKPGMVKPGMVKPSMADGHEPERSEGVTGEIVEYGGEMQVIAAAYIPELDVHVNVHQKSSGIEQSVSHILKPVIPLGTAVSLGLIVFTTALIMGIMRRYENRLAAINENLEHLVQKRTRSLRKTRDAVIFGLAKLAESRDTDTGEHLDRIRLYVTILAKHLNKTNPNEDSLCVENLGLASSLHDIGKVGIPDSILLKPGGFTEEERKIMEYHAGLGGACIKAIGEKLGDDDFLQLARDIAYFHHEKWDGTGYPFRLSGESIPLSARIVALADVYDALRSRRPYKEPMAHEKAASIILEGRATHFDSVIVDAFVDCEESFIEVSNRYAAMPLQPKTILSGATVPIPV